jgi:hypothetical protein
MAGLFRGTSEMTDLKRGSDDVLKVYRGTNLVWERSTPIPLLDSYDFYYDAGKSTTFIDQTTNGNDGTEYTSPGGSGAITHISGAEPYWNFTVSTKPGKYVDTGTTLGNVTGASYTQVIVVKPVFVDMCYVMFIDGAPSQTYINISDTSGKIQYKTGFTTNLDPTTSLSASNYYLIITVVDGTNKSIYINDVLRATNTSLNTGTYTSSMKLGWPLASTNKANAMKICATGIMTDKALDATERTEIYDYYNGIYSF